MRQPSRGRFYFLIAACVIVALSVALRVPRLWKRLAGQAAPAVKRAADGNAEASPRNAFEPGAEVRTYPQTKHSPASMLELVMDPVNLPPAPNAVDVLADFEGRNIQDIDVRGCLRQSESDVLKRIRSRKGTAFNQRTWEDDWHRLDDSGLFLNIRTTEPMQVQGGVRLTIDVVENATIEKLAVEGVSDETASALEKEIKSIAGGIYVKGQMHLDRLGMERFLRERGYADARVDYTVEVMDTHTQRIGGKEVDVEDVVNVAFSVAPGQRTRIRSLRLKNLTVLAERDVLEQLELKPYGWFVASRLKSDRNRIAAFYLRSGYADVVVSEAKTEGAGTGVSKLDGVEDRLIDVSYTLAEGVQHVIGAVKLTGNEKLMSEELLRVVETQPGALLVDQTIKQDGLRLEGFYADRGWNNARVSPIRVRVTDPERLKFATRVWDVVFRVNEGKKKIKLEFVGGDGTRKEGVVLGEPNPDGVETPVPAPPKSLKLIIQKLETPKRSTEKTDEQF